MGILLLLACVVFSRHVIKSKDLLEDERARVVREQVTEARRSVEEFQAPFCVIAADTFVELGSLQSHEVLRDDPKVRLEYYDSLADVEAARAGGKHMVFLSHQWLANDAPDLSARRLRLRLPRSFLRPR